MRKLVLLALIVPLLAGCGSDDEGSAPATSTSQPDVGTSTTTKTTKTEPNPATETQPNDGNGQPGSSTSPESQQGGAGDETPAEVQALFVGNGGGITPPIVRVPAYISIRVELRSADGGDYSLTFAGKTVKPGGSLRLDGLKPGAKVVGKPGGGGASVRIEATAEPGP